MNDKSSVANYKVSKIKVLYAKINERTIHNQRYFEILYKEVGKDYECVGYGSFYLSAVQEWLEMCFEVVGEEQDRRTKMTGNEYQKLAMRTNDRQCTQRLRNKADSIELYREYLDYDLPEVGIGTEMDVDLGGIINGLFGLSGEVVIGTEMDVDLGGIINGLFGLSGEVGELTDMVKKWIFHEKELDEDHAKKELGDVMWYIAMICESFGWSLDEIMQMNIDKLKKRYPDGFDTERANNRSPEDV